MGRFVFFIAICLLIPMGGHLVVEFIKIVKRDLGSCFTTLAIVVFLVLSFLLFITR